MIKDDGHFWIDNRAGMFKKIILIGNPIAGGGALKKINKAFSSLKDKGYEAQLMLTTKKGDAESFARQIRQQKRPPGTDSSLLVIAAGGDGTYNEVANGLINSDIPMAILPLGTTSVLAKEVNIPDNLEMALNIALNGKIQTIHLGKITFMKDKGHTPHPSLVTRYFLLMAGIGFDADAVFNVDEGIKKVSGKGAYVLSGLKTLIRYNPKLFLIKYNSKETSGYNAIIGKASCYGGDFKITPDASLTDPYFYIFLMHKKSKIDLLKKALIIIQKKDNRNIKDTSYFKAKEIEVYGDAPVQIDGDYIGRLPAKIEIVTNALKLIY